MNTSTWDICQPQFRKDAVLFLTNIKNSDSNNDDDDINKNSNNDHDEVKESNWINWGLAYEEPYLMLVQEQLVKYL